MKLLFSIGERLDYLEALENSLATANHEPDRGVSRASDDDDADFDAFAFVDDDEGAVGKKGKKKAAKGKGVGKKSSKNKKV